MLVDFTKKSFDILIQAGQSNAEGFSCGPVEKPYEPNNRVYYLNEDMTISQALEKTSGNNVRGNFGLLFSEEYIKNGRLAEGRDILIIRAASGGSGFSSHEWGMGEDMYVRMIDMIDTALALNGHNRLVALLWHQGEREAVNYVSYEKHYENLMNFVKSVKERFSTPELPFIAADFVHHWKNKNLDICEPIIQAIRDVCRDCGKGGFIETDGLRSNNEDFGLNDNIHFSRRSMYELGRRYYACFENIISKQS